MSCDDYIGRRVTEAMIRRSTPVTLRRVTTTTGPNPSPNPPNIVGPVFDGSYAIDATQVDIRASSVRGRLVAGDRFTHRGTVHTIAGTYAAANNRFTGVEFSPALATAIIDGDPVVFTWSADTTVYCSINSYPRRLVDGTLIQASDLDVVMAANGYPEPQLTDQLLILGKLKSIVTISPVFHRAKVVQWRLQAR